jgi:Phytanoyl-CoA dioxygenase (PhyH)
MELSDLNIPWLESPFFERLLARSDLDEPTRSLVRTYAADGYLTFDPKIPDFDGVAASILDACARRSDYPLRVTDAWLEIEGVRRLSLAPAVLSLLRTLYRREPVPMQTLNFGRGTEQRPHSDSIHFSSVPRGFMCGVWIALEDVDETNGALEYYPNRRNGAPSSLAVGSHRSTRGVARPMRPHSQTDCVSGKHCEGGVNVLRAALGIGIG